MPNIQVNPTIGKLNGQNRANFDCGSEALNNYLRITAGQDHKKKVSVLYVMCLNDEVIGYYTLSSGSVDVSDLPPEATKKLPKYPKVPVTLIGRLAVDSSYQGRGYGALLLADALRRAAISSESIASYAVVVDAKDANAESFYRTFDFIPFEDTRKLYLPMRTIITAYIGQTSSGQGTA